MKNSLKFFKELSVPLRSVLIPFYFLSITCCIGQASIVNPTNTPSGPGDFLGWNPGVNSQLAIRHNTPDQPIIFSTDGVERMRINPNRTVTVNTTNNNFARFRILQDVTGGTAVKALISNVNGNNTNYSIHTRLDDSPGWGYAVVTQALGVSEDVDYALRGIADGPSSNSVYGIYARTQGNGQIGNPAAGNWAAIFQGSVSISNGTFFSSDSNLKNNIEDLTDSREKLLALKPVSFHFVGDSPLNLSSKLQYGFIAQEVQETIPELVREVSISIPNLEEENSSEFNHLSLNRIELIPILVQGVNQHQDKINENNSRIDQLTEQLENAQTFLNNSKE